MMIGRVIGLNEWQSVDVIVVTLTHQLPSENDHRGK